MLVKYKRNKCSACYDSDCLTSAGRITPLSRPCDPFKSYGECPYASHGFVDDFSDLDRLGKNLYLNPVSTKELAEFDGKAYVEKSQLDKALQRIGAETLSEVRIEIAEHTLPENIADIIFQI